MKKVVLVVVTVAAAVSGLAGVAWVVWGRSSDTGAAAAGPALARPALTVDVAQAERGPMADIITVVGSLEGEASVEVSSKVNGRLEEVAVRIGDRVAQGRGPRQGRDPARSRSRSTRRRRRSRSPGPPSASAKPT